MAILRIMIVAIAKLNDVEISANSTSKLSLERNFERISLKRGLLKLLRKECVILCLEISKVRSERICFHCIIIIKTTVMWTSFLVTLTSFLLGCKVHLITWRFVMCALTFDVSIYTSTDYSHYIVQWLWCRLVF